jgi:hypothetical protein
MFAYAIHNRYGLAAAIVFLAWLGWVTLGALNEVSGASPPRWVPVEDLLNDDELYHSLHRDIPEGHSLQIDNSGYQLLIERRGDMVAILGRYNKFMEPMERPSFMKRVKKRLGL